MALGSLELLKSVFQDRGIQRVLFWCDYTKLKVVLTYSAKTCSSASGDMGWVPGLSQRKCEMVRLWN